MPAACDERQDQVVVAVRNQVARAIHADAGIVRPLDAKARQREERAARMEGVRGDA